jgi:catechol 2,3-dioxygenase-like lactoylglutathione lyase family enzyme
MFFGMHALIYCKDADKARAFFRDVLKWPHVDAGQGWLIFELPPAELGIHPTMEGDPESHALYLMTKDVKKTVAQLEKHGVQCAPIQDAGFGLLTSFELPGGGPLGMYQPRHPIAAGMSAKAPKKQVKARRSSRSERKPKRSTAAQGVGGAKKTKPAAKKPPRKPAKKTAKRKKR